MADRKVFLKVKLKSLAFEAYIIKREEQRRKIVRGRARAYAQRDQSEAVKADIRRLRGVDAARRAARRSKPWYLRTAQELHELTRHRLDVVRVEARLTGIAYAIIRGRSLSCVDSLAGLTPKHWERVQAMLRKYGDPDQADTYSQAQSVKQAA